MKHRSAHVGDPQFLSAGRHSIWLGWPARWLAVVCAVAVVVGMTYRRELAARI